MGKGVGLRLVGCAAAVKLGNVFHARFFQAFIPPGPAVNMADGITTTLRDCRQAPISSSVTLLIDIWKAIALDSGNVASVHVLGRGEAAGCGQPS